MQKMYTYTKMLCLPVVNTVVFRVVVSTVVVGTAKPIEEEWSKHMAREECTVVETVCCPTQSCSLWKRYLVQFVFEI